MLQQSITTNNNKPFIYIPQIIRYSLPQHSLLNSSSEPLNIQTISPFQSLKNQLQQLKPQLALNPQKSRFTRVFSIQDQCNENFKLQNTRAQYLYDQNEQYKINLQKFLQSFQMNQKQSEKQQKQFALNTKNILRNVCNAQNQFILFNSSAQQILNLHLKCDLQFKAWVNKLRFHTFEEFQKVWKSIKRPLFTKLYKKLCKKFYIENAIPYIMNSRIKNKQTKVAHIRYLYRFLQGLQNPSDFFYFKQKQKQKTD